MARLKKPRHHTVALKKLPAGVSDNTKAGKPTQKIDLQAQNLIDDYVKNKTENNRIVVYTAVVGGYDVLKLPEYLNPSIDYVCFSDYNLDGYGIWDVRKIDYYHSNQSKIARYIKTHPHRFFENDYDVAMWLDGNILIRGDLEKYAHALLDSKYSFGSITHPVRKCTYEEARTCRELKKDTASNIGKQIRKYKRLGFPSDLGLIETNFLVIDLHSPIVKDAFRLWWNEINNHSHRDQLSVMYAFREHALGIMRVLPPNKSVRNHPDFVKYEHEKRSKYRLPEVKKTPKQKPTYFHEIREKRLVDVPDVKVDVVICVHNALTDFKRLAKSLKSYINRTNFRVVIVNDGSGEDTSKYIAHYANNRAEKIKVIHNEKPKKYTKAANQGLQVDGADVKILVNSDVVFSERSIDKMLLALYSEESLGAIGPLSNAAGKQSIPNIKSTKTNTAINTLPRNYTIEDVDLWCEKISVADFYPRIELLHGFCLAIKTDVFEDVGYFDEKAFPRGYGEENDFCFRAADAGYSLAVATNTFVYHAKSKSYTNAQVRKKLMTDGLKILESRYLKRLDDARVQIKDHPELERIRAEASRLWRTAKKSIHRPKKKSTRTRKRT